LNELQILAQGGFNNKTQTSERAGEILGSLASKFLIATCIISVRTQFGKKREIRKLNSALNTLEVKLGLYSDKAWTLDQHPWGGELDNQSVAIGMGKSQRFLISSTEPDVVLAYELNVGSHLVDFRYQVMRNFAPSYLREKLWEGIKQVTGVTLNNEGLPIK
jgi:hypothetical protein